MNENYFYGLLKWMLGKKNKPSLRLHEMRINYILQKKGQTKLHLQKESSRTIFLSAIFLQINYLQEFKRGESGRNFLDSPWPLLVTLLPWVRIIWLSSSCNSDLSSANLLLLFFTMDATSESDRLSVATSRNFSAPSFIYGGSRKIRAITINLISYCFLKVSQTSIKRKHKRSNLIR